jgi:hypothetical protein
MMIDEVLIFLLNHDLQVIISLKKLTIFLIILIENSDLIQVLI